MSSAASICPECGHGDGEHEFLCERGVEEIRERAYGSAATTGLPPLDSEGVLWIAAIECFPIEERIAWVAKMKARVDEINAGRATYDGDPPGAGWSE